LSVCPFVRRQTADGRQQQNTGGYAADSSAVGRLPSAVSSSVGGVSQDSERLQAPSGGFATALLCRLLEENKIDAAIVATPTTERPWFERRIATTK
jgi:coenzyme F420-reducing hydrogenase beta subunit